LPGLALAVESQPFYEPASSIFKRGHTMPARSLYALLLTLAFTALLRAQTRVSSAGSPPDTPKRDVTDDYFGTKIVDQYRWLEDLKSPEVSAWMRAQNDYTRSVLHRIPGHEKLHARIAELDNTGVRVGGFQSYGGRWFYLRRAPGEDNQKLYTRDGANGSERLLLDPETLTAKGVHYSIDYYTPSRDGNLVAIGISPGGSENSVLHVLDTATGKDLGERIDRAQFGSVAWLPNDRSFFYNRLHRPAPGEMRPSYYLNSRVYLHFLGSDPDADAAVFGNGLSPAVSVVDSDIPFVGLPVGSKYLIGVIAHGVQNEQTIYIAKLADVHDASAPWHKIVDVEDDVTGADIQGDQLYLTTHHNASRFKVLRVNLPDGDVKSAEVVVPASEAVVATIAAAADALYVQSSTAASENCGAFRSMAAQRPRSACHSMVPFRNCLPMRASPGRSYAQPRGQNRPFFCTTIPSVT
jgi:prolyl oligopeptidase